MSFRDLQYKCCLIVISCLFSLNNSFASTCSNSESLKTLIEQKNYRRALQNLDNCLSIQKQPSSNNLRMFDQLIKQVLTPNDSISFNEGYRNFQTVLSIHWLDSLTFRLKSHFEKYPKKEAKLFSKLREKGEKYYFYYDTGRIFPYTRGIALTDKSLIWKNLTSSSHRLTFNQIKNIKLVYKPGLSLTGWKIIVNNNENLDIRLSEIPDKALIFFVSAITYFINFNKTLPDKDWSQFYIPEREMAIVAGWITRCHYQHVNQDSPIKELQRLDACFASYGKGFKLSQTDRDLLKKLTTSIFERHDIPFLIGYNNFKVILSTHFFQDLNFKFKNYFNIKTTAKIFQDIHLTDEKYYFYFDTGVMIANSRGIALTDKAIIWKNLLGSSISWKNLTGSTNRLAFDKISSATLIYENSLESATDRKLRFNKNKAYEIILSKLSKKNVELFTSALVYFINIASNANLRLQINPNPKKVQ